MVTKSMRYFSILDIIHIVLRHSLCSTLSVLVIGISVVDAAPGVVCIVVITGVVRDVELGMSSTSTWRLCCDCYLFTLVIYSPPTVLYCDWKYVSSLAVILFV